MIEALPAIASAAGNVASAIFGNSQADKNIKLQKQFAQNAIQWKVADAEKAGVHPLYALGAQTHSFAPVGVGDVGSSIAAAGQDLGRAVGAVTPEAGRLGAYTVKIQGLQLQRAALENELLASQIAKLNQPATPPAPPSADQRWLIDGQGSATDLVKTSLMSRTASEPNHPWSEPGSVNDIGYARTSSGWAPVYGGDVKQRLEEDTLGSIGWNLRNRIPQSLGLNLAPPPGVPLEKGKAWIYNPATQEYVQVSDRLARILNGNVWKGKFQH